MFVRRQRAHDHTLHTAFTTTQRAARERDVALRAMAQGLCMFDREQKLIVCNEVYRKLYGLSEDQTKPGATFQAIQEYRIASGNVQKDNIDDIQRRIADISDNKAYTTINQLSDGRFVSVIHQPIAGGGWVATHEDVTERKLAESRIEQLAHYDALTNLANRHLFQETGATPDAVAPQWRRLLALPARSGSIQGCERCAWALRRRRAPQGSLNADQRIIEKHRFGGAAWRR
jgi:predicted signal transduction protein with EAL and GGDEF domain